MLSIKSGICGPSVGIRPIGHPFRIANAPSRSRPARPGSRGLSSRCSGPCALSGRGGKPAGLSHAHWGRRGSTRRWLAGTARRMASGSGRAAPAARPHRPAGLVRVGPVSAGHRGDPVRSAPPEGRPPIPPPAPVPWWRLWILPVGSLDRCVQRPRRRHRPRDQDGSGMRTVHRARASRLRTRRSQP